VIAVAALVLVTGIAAGVATLLADRSLQPPALVFRALSATAHGRVAWLSVGDMGAPPRVTQAACARVQFARDAGICLVEEPRGREVAHVAYVLDRRFARHHRVELAGIPVRCRLSRDGRWAGITTYAEEELPEGERLAMTSVLLDIQGGRILANLRDFTLDKGPFDRIRAPVDFASITFLDHSDRFYVTVTSGGTRYLAEGSVGGRNIRVLREGLANEALSADGRRLIAKHLAGDSGFWQVTVIDLESWHQTTLQHARSVDDQVDWFDADRVMYHDVTDGGTGIWTLPADGSGGPQLLVPDAYSPSTVR
jgi:hypothetical protein